MANCVPHTANLPPLASAVVVCRERETGALLHVVESVSAFLDFGHPRFWSMVGAGSLGSVRLLQRLAVRAEPESDRHYRAFLFRHALVGAVVSDSLPTVQWLCANYCPWGFVSLAMDKAVELGRLEIAQWLASHQHERLLWNPRFVDQADMRCADLAAQNGHLAMLQWLDTQPAIGGCTEDAMSAAALHGHFDVVRWLHERGAGSIAALRSAIRGGHLEIVQFLFECGDDNARHLASDHGLDDAARSGNLALVQWLHEVAITGCSKHAMDNAASNGDLEIVQWLHANRSEGCSTAAMDGAALHGHLRVLRWLHATRPEGCTVDAMDNAASAGHVAVLQWLHANRPEGGSTAALDRAASNGHLSVVQWLLATRDDGYTHVAMQGAITNGHLHVVEWLHAHCVAFASPETLFWRRLCATYAGDLAAAGGHLRVVQWLHVNGFACFSADAMVGAARGNHLHVLQWLHANRSDGSSPDAMDEAGSLAVVQWLHAHRSEGCTSAAMDNAVASADFATVRFLHATVGARCSRNVSRSIRNFGDHAELWLWLCEHYRTRVDVYDIYWRFYERDDLRAFLKQLGL